MGIEAPPPSFVIAAGAVWPPLCLIAVCLRFYSRRKQSGGRRWAVDDWLTVPALIFTWGLGGVIISGVVLRGFGYTTPKPPEGFTSLTYSNYTTKTVRRDLWIFELLQIPGLTCVKLSFVFFYRRVFCDRSGNKAFDYLTKAVIALLISWMLAFWLSLFFACHGHFTAYWQSVAYVTTHCPKTLIWENAFAISDAILDIIVYVLPLRQIAALDLSSGKKFALLAIFSLGAVTIAASLTRMAIFIEVIEVDFSASTDNDLIITSGLYWSMIESGLGLLSANLPSIYTLVKTLVRKASSKASDRNYTTRSKWVQNLSNFKSRKRSGLTFSESEVTGFRTFAQAEPISLEDLPSPESNRVMVESHVEVTWRNAKVTTPA